MITIGKFYKKDINKLEIAKEEKAEMIEYYDLYLAGDNSPAINVKYNNLIQGIGGVRLLSKNVGESWMCWNFDFLHEHKKRIIVKIRDYIDFVGVTFNLKKVQAVIDSSSEKDKQFIRFLGFKYKKKLESGFDIYVKGV